MIFSAFANLGNGVSGIVAILGIPFVLYQLHGLNKTLKIAGESAKHSNLMSIFNIEFELNRRKERIADIRRQVLDKIGGRDKTQISTEEKKALNFLDGFEKEAYEDYLNVFDRLSYFILNGKFDEEDFRLEYREMLFETIEHDKHEMFTTKTRYRNMIKLYDSWKDK
jgi:hypothetical protein